MRRPAPECCGNPLPDAGKEPELGQRRACRECGAVHVCARHDAAVTVWDMHPAGLRAVKP